MKSWKSRQSDWHNVEMVLKRAEKYAKRVEFVGFDKNWHGIRVRCANENKNPKAVGLCAKQSNE